MRQVVRRAASLAAVISMVFNVGLGSRSAFAAMPPATLAPVVQPPLQRANVTRLSPPAPDQRRFYAALAQHAAPPVRGLPARVPAAGKPLYRPQQASTQAIVTTILRASNTARGTRTPVPRAGAAMSLAAQLVTSSPVTGINPWWTYEEDALPGVGKYSINVGNGNVLMQADDMMLKHKGVALAFRRTYNSLSKHDYVGTDGSQISNYGDGWTNSYDAHLAVNSGKVCGSSAVTGLTVFDVDGAQYDYMPNCAGGFTPPAGQFGALAVDADGLGFQWTKKSGTVYDFFNPTQAASTQGLAGRLRRISGRSWNTYLSFTYTFDSGDSSTSAKLQQIDVAPEYAATGTTTGHVILSFVDFYTTVCNPPHPCTKANIHRLLSTLTWPDGTIVAYNYILGSTYAMLAVVSEPGDDASTGSCVSASQTVCSNQSYMPTSDNAHIGSVVSPRAYQNSSDGAIVQFQYNSDGTISSVVQRAVVNFTPNDGLNLPINNGAASGQVIFHTVALTRGTGTATLNDSDAKQVVFTYDSLGRVTKTVASVSATSSLSTTRGWGSNNYVAYQTDPRGNRTDYAYDANGNIIAEAHPAVTYGTTYRPTSYFSYDANNNLTAQCDPVWSHANGKDWTSAPATSDSLCPAASGVTQYVWTPVSGSEPFGELTAVVQPLGYTRTFQYNASSQGGTDYGQVTDVIGSSGGLTSWTQNDGTSYSTHSTYQYDSKGNVTSFGTGAGTWTMTYTAANFQQTVKDADGVTTHYNYYPDGLMSQSETAYQYATNTPVKYTYDVDRNTTGETHNFGGVVGTTQTFFDGWDRAVEVVKPHDSHDWHSYAWFARYIYDTTQGGTVSIGNDPSGALVSGLKAYGNLYKSQLYYQPLDANKNSLPLAFYDTIGTSFDALDRQISNYDASGAFAAAPQKTNAYDEPGTLSGEQARSGLLSSVTDGTGEKTILHYDQDARLYEKQFQNSSSQAVQYTFNPDGRPLTVAQTGLGTETIAYDVEEKVTSDTTPPVGAETGTTVVQPSYYPNGFRKALSVNAASAGLNVTNLYEYSYRTDGFQQTVKVNLGTGSTFQYTYSAAGRRKTMSDPATGTALPAASTSAVPIDIRTPAGRYTEAATSRILRALGIAPRTSGTQANYGPAFYGTAAPVLDPHYVETRPAGKRAPGGGTPSQVMIRAAAATERLAPSAVPAAQPSTFQATSFGYDGYGRLNAETLPTGASYNSFAYDPEGEVTQFVGYAQGTSSETIKNAYTTRGELVGRHFYLNGGSSTDVNWPHFSSQPDFAVMLPASENVQPGVTLQTQFYEGDGLMYTSEQFNSTNNAYLQGYGWQVDQAGRQIYEFESNSTPASYGGALQRTYDAENHLTGWVVLKNDPNNSSLVESGWPVENQDINIDMHCNAPPPTQPLNRYPPNTSITYAWGPHGRVIGETVNNPGLSTTHAQLHWDNATPLFTTDSSGKVDSVRVGTQAIVTASGTAVMLDRDWTGAWVLTHSVGGFSAWDPPDPYLENCKPTSPPPGSSNYNPPGFPLQFGQETADTVTDGYNFFAGVSNYDPQAQQWSAPDPLENVVPDPDRQQPYMFNRNNPVQYADPSGFDALELWDPKPVFGIGHTSVLIWDPITNQGIWWSQGPVHELQARDVEQVTETVVPDVQAFIKEKHEAGWDYQNKATTAAQDAASNSYAQLQWAIDRSESPNTYNGVWNNCDDFVTSTEAGQRSMGHGGVPGFRETQWQIYELLHPNAPHGPDLNGSPLGDYNPAPYVADDILEEQPVPDASDTNETFTSTDWT